MTEDISLDLMYKTSDNIQRLLDVTARIDEKIKSIVSKQAEIEFRISEVSRGSLEDGRRIAAIEAKLVGDEFHEFQMAELARIAAIEAKLVGVDFHEFQKSELVRLATIDAKLSATQAKLSAIEAKLVGEEFLEFSSVTKERLTAAELGIRDLKDHWSSLMAMDRRLVLVEEVTKGHESRWNSIFQFVTQLVWIVLAAYVLYKLNLSPPPVP